MKIKGVDGWILCGTVYPGGNDRLHNLNNQTKIADRTTKFKPLLLFLVSFFPVFLHWSLCHDAVSFYLGLSLLQSRRFHHFFFFLSFLSLS